MGNFKLKLYNIFAKRTPLVALIFFILFSGCNPALIEIPSPNQNITRVFKGTRAMNFNAIDAVLLGGAPVNINIASSDPRIAHSELYYSSDGGISFALIATATRFSVYEWTVPGAEVASAQLKLVTTVPNLAPQTSTSNFFSIDNTAPAVTLTQPTGATNIAPGASLAIQYSITDNHPNSATQTLEISRDGGTTWGAIASGLASSGPYAWTVTAPETYQAKIRATAIDVVGHATTVVSPLFIIDGTSPVLTAATLQLNGGTPADTHSAYAALSFSATDAFSPVTQVCFKVKRPFDVTIPAAPAAGDACWTDLNVSAARAIAVTSVNPHYQHLGFTQGNYSIFVYVKDSGNHISVLSNSGNGTVYRDRYDVTFDPLDPPTVSNIRVANADVGASFPTSAQIQFAPTDHAYIQWNIVSPGGLDATHPIALQYTTDGLNYTDIATAVLINGVNGSCTVSAAHTGCYDWSGPFPAGYFRLRVVAKNLDGLTNSSASEALNSGSFRIIAGDTEKNIGLSAKGAIFPAWRDSSQSSLLDAMNIAILPNGTLYVRDSAGVYQINPITGLLSLVVPVTGASTGDGGVSTSASLKSAGAITYHKLYGLLIRDHDRIRKINLNTNVITTLIGGGATDVSDTVADATQVKFTTASHPLYDRSPIWVAPNGDIYFRSESGSSAVLYTPSSAIPYRIRQYTYATGAVSAIRPSGTGYQNVSGFQTVGLANCPLGAFGLVLDPESSAPQQFLISVLQGGACGTGVVATDAGGAPLSSQPTLPANLSVGTTLAYYANPKTQALYVSDTARVFSYSATDNTPGVFTNILGTSGSNAIGVCAAGVDPTTCNLTITGMTFHESGTLYFMDRGIIQTLNPENGQTINLYGQSLSSGDGLPPQSARFARIESFDLTEEATPRIVMVDPDELVIREFPTSPTDSSQVSLVAGNRNRGSVVDGATANTTSLSENTNRGFGIATDPTNGDLFFHQLSGNDFFLFKLERTGVHAGVWQKVAGNTTGVAADQFENAADNTDGPLVRLSRSGSGITGTNYVYPVGVIGNYVYVLFKKFGANNDLLKAFHKDTFKFFHIAGLKNTAAWPATGSTAATNSILAYNGAHAIDREDGRIVFDEGSANRIRAVTPGATADRISNFSIDPGNSPAIAYQRNSDFSVDYFYYCDVNGALYRVNLNVSATPTLLAMPTSSMHCTGSKMVYDRVSDALYFSVLQNGVSAMVQLSDPAAY